MEEGEIASRARNGESTSSSYQHGSVLDWADKQGQPIPPKHHLYASDNLPRPEYSTPASRRGSEPMQDQRSKTPDLRYNGPAYAALPNHSDDIRRLIEECVAAKESARVLTEALVFTRPEDLPSKPIIKVCPNLIPDANG